MQYTAPTIAAILGIGLLTGALGQGASPDQVAGMSNAKQLGLGMLMYFNDYDDIAPYVQSTKTLRPLIAPYLRSKNAWQTHNPNSSEFLFNMCIAGVHQADVQLPAKTPMFYESKPWPDGTRIVAYADGHVKITKSDAWPAVKEFLHLKIKRKAKPLPVGYMSGKG